MRARCDLDKGNSVEFVAPDEGKYPTDSRPAWELWANGEYQTSLNPAFLKRELWKSIQRLITLPGFPISFSLVHEHLRRVKQVVDDLYDQYHGFIS